MSLNLSGSQPTAFRFSSKPGRRAKLCTWKKMGPVVMAPHLNIQRTSDASYFPSPKHNSSKRMPDPEQIQPGISLKPRNPAFAVFSVFFPPFSPSQPPPRNFHSQPIPTRAPDTEKAKRNGGSPLRSYRRDGSGRGVPQSEVSPAETQGIPDPGKQGKYVRC